MQEKSSSMFRFSLWFIHCTIAYGSINYCLYCRRTSSVKVDGHFVKPGVILLTGVDNTGTPQLSEVSEILVDRSNRLYCGIKLVAVIEYSSHFHSWAIELTQTKKLILLSELHIIQLSVPRTSSSGIVFVSFKHCM